MQAVWKFPLDTRTDTVFMPKGAKILSVAMQHGSVTVWALVDANAPTGPRVIKVVGTGWSIHGEPGVFLGTVYEGPFVWHVFDQGEV